MLVANFCIVVFLALKNTPLAILSAYSYERLNGLHQIAGHTTFVYLVLHASMYTNYFFTSGYLEILQEDVVKAGYVAGFAFLGLAFSGAIVRQFSYEVFLVIHVACFIIGLIAAAFHQPDLAVNGLLIMLAIIAGIWGADRLVRGARMLFYSFNNYATLEPLPNGGTRIILTKKPYAAVPGKHCFVWIPAIRKFESHPFTIAATEPMEFVVNAYDGFTRDLHKRAVANPGVKLRVSVDGPYGTFPDPMTFDKVVLIAGGSGATFTFGLATNMLERMGPEARKSIVLIWTVKKHGKSTKNKTVPFHFWEALGRPIRLHRTPAPPAGIRLCASEGQYRPILTSGTRLQHLGTSQPWTTSPPPSPFRKPFLSFSHPSAKKAPSTA